MEKKKRVRGIKGIVVTALMTLVLSFTVFAGCTTTIVYESGVSIDALFERYLQDHPGATYENFLSEYLSFDYSPTQVAVNKALRSVVSVRAGFKVRSGSGFSAKTEDVISLGSGVIYRLDSSTGEAYIITNYHVIYASDSTSSKTSTDIKLCTYGMEYYGGSGSSLDYSIKATFIGGSITKDIAILKTEANDILKNDLYRAADIADSNSIVVGGAAIAVGNPEGEGLAATSGIVNVDSEYIDMSKIDGSSGNNTHRVMRVDAAINAGNSGGGLFNGSGEMIGIVNAKAVDTEIDNIGYAIPSNVAVGIAKSVRDEVKVKYTIGVDVAIKASASVFENGYLMIKEKLEVSGVTTGSPAASGGVQKGDILVSAKLGGSSVEISRLFTLSDFLYAARSGDKLILTVLRDSAETELTVTISASSSTDL